MDGIGENKMDSGLVVAGDDGVIGAVSWVCQCY